MSATHEDFADLISRVEAEFGLVAGSVTRLGGEVDLNLKMECTDGSIFLIKATEIQGDSDTTWQGRILDHVAQCDSRIPIPKIVRTHSGLTEISVQASATRYQVRVMTWLDGEVIGRAEGVDFELLGELGALAGSMYECLQSADRTGDGGEHVRPRSGADARGEGGRIELVLRVEDERRVHRAHPAGGRRRAVQQVKEVTADRLVVGLDLDATPVLAEVVPVEQHRPQRGDQPVGDVARARLVVVVGLRQDRPKHGDSGAHDVHRMRGGRDAFEGVLHRGRQTPERAELRLVGRQLDRVGKRAVDQQVRDLLELGGLGELEDVVPAVVQVVAGAADGREGRVAGRDSGQGDGLLRLEAGGRRGGVGVGHGDSFYSDRLAERSKVKILLSN